MRMLVRMAAVLTAIFAISTLGDSAPVSRDRILRACYIGFGVCSVLLFALTLHGLRSPWPIYAVLLLNGTVRAFNAWSYTEFAAVT